MIAIEHVFFLMHSSGPERGVKKHSERGHQMKVLKTEDLGFQYIIQDVLNFKARKTLSGSILERSHWKSKPHKRMIATVSNWTGLGLIKLHVIWRNNIDFL